MEDINHYKAFGIPNNKLTWITSSLNLFNLMTQISKEGYTYFLENDIIPATISLFN